MQSEKGHISTELGSIWNTAQVSGNLQPGRRWEPGDGQLLRENIRNKGRGVFWLNRLDVPGFFAEDRLG